MAEYARYEINEIGDYYAYSKELINGDSVYDFDITKLSVNTLNLGLAGIEVYDILRDDYDIQVEFGDIGNILAYISVGDRQRDLERLVSAMSEIRRRFKRDKTGMLRHEYINPLVVKSPQEAVLRRKGGAAHNGEQRQDMQRICDVLSAGHTNTGPRRDDYRRNTRLYFVRKAQGLYDDRVRRISIWSG